MIAPLPLNEKARLAALRELKVLDTDDELEYNDVVLIASQLCGTPIALISLIDEDRQWFKARIGLDARQTHRDLAFCAHAILNPSETFVVEDASKDGRFADNPLVTADPHIRFYAGTPLTIKGGIALGTLCVIDREPRELNRIQIRALEALARQISLRFELRSMADELRRTNESLKNLSLTDELTGIYNRRGFFVHAEQQLKLYRSRESQYSMWLLASDMDGLKYINDTFGHDEGSEAIKAVVDIMKLSFRDADIVARVGGDEFIVLIPNCSDETAKRLPGRLEQGFANYNATSGKPYKVDMSVGLVKAEFESDELIADLLNRADHLMYEEKYRRKNRRQAFAEPSPGFAAIISS